MRHHIIGTCGLELERLFHFSFNDRNGLHRKTFEKRIAICTYSLRILDGYNLVSIVILSKKENFNTIIIHFIIANLDCLRSQCSITNDLGYLERSFPFVFITHGLFKIMNRVIFFGILFNYPYDEKANECYDNACHNTQEERFLIHCFIIRFVYYIVYTDKGQKFIKDFCCHTIFCAKINKILNKKKLLRQFIKLLSI